MHELQSRAHVSLNHSISYFWDFSGREYVLLNLFSAEFWLGIKKDRPKHGENWGFLV